MRSEKSAMKLRLGKGSERLNQMEDSQIERQTLETEPKGRGVSTALVTAAVTAVLLIVAIVSSAFSSGLFDPAHRTPQKVIDAYFDAIESLNFDALMDCLLPSTAQTIRQAVEKNYEGDAQEYLSEAFSNMKTDFGEGYSFQIRYRAVQTIADPKEIAKHDAEYVEQGVEMISIVTLSMTASSADGTREKTQETQTLCVRMDGIWYMAA